jgi:ankyrin repeat protein
MAETDELLEAARAGDLQALERLLDSSIPVDARNEHGNGALIAAVGEGREEAVRFLLGHGATPDIRNAAGITPLMVAARYGLVEIMAILCEAGAALDAESNEGVTPLQQAICRGGPAAVRFLIARGVDVNKASMGQSPLRYAEGEELGEVVEVLLAAGAKR